MASLLTRFGRTKQWLGCLGLVTLVGLAFIPIFRCDFLVYDDWEYVVTNDMVRRGLTTESVLWAFQKFHSSNWHPLTWISHMADVQLYGLKPVGHHVTNLVLHIANVVLLFALLRRLTGSFWRSVWVAALFGIHPTHVESVAWVAERKDVLSTFFGLLALHAYARYAKQFQVPSSKFQVSRAANSQQTAAQSRPTGFRFLGSGWYWLTFVLLALGLMSKPMLVTWPFVMLLLDFWPLGRLSAPSAIVQLPSARQVLLEKFPFLLLALGSCVVTFFAQRAGGAVQTMEQLSPVARLGNAVISYVRYLGKTIWPTNLSIYYPYPAAWPMWSVVAAAGLLIGLGALVWWQRQSRSYLMVGLGWFLGTLVPVIGLVQVGGQSMADRYLYLPQIGLGVAVAWGVADLAARRHLARWVIAGLGLFPLTACLLLTPARVRDWQNSETIFTQALRVTEGNYIAHNNLGLHYLDRKQYEAAIKCFTSALALRPAFAATHSNLGLALAALQRTDEAIAHLEEALRLNPGLTAARVNLANLFITRARFPEALPLLEEAVRVAPEYPEGRCSLANVLLEFGRFDDATQEARAALRLRPDYADALNCLGTICLKQGKYSDATSFYQAALTAKPGFAEAQCNLALAAATQGKSAEAASQYEAALRLNPDLLSAHFGLAIVLEQLGRPSEGAEHWAAALKLSPDLWAAHEQMGLLLNRQGKLVEALPHFVEAVRLQPRNARLRAGYGLTLDQLGEAGRATEQYQAALELQPEAVEVLNNLAWILATHADPALRNGAKAVALAQQACELTQFREARFVGTFAAACAEAGQFEKAIAMGLKAGALARASDQPDLAQRNEELLELYRHQKPFHEPPVVPQP